MLMEKLLTSPKLFIAEAPEIGRDQPLGLKNPELLNQLEPTGNDIEGYDLYAKKFGDQTIFALKKDDQILSVLIGTEISDFPSQVKKPTIVVQRSWTLDEMRGQGLSPALYDGLGRLNYRIVSDKLASRNALRVWGKLGTKRQIKAFDWTTKQYTDEEPLDNPNISYVLEHSVCFARSGILKDSLVWT